MEAKQTLDAHGLKLPPAYFAHQKKLGTLQSGETLKVIATDPGSLKDMSTFCDQTGNAFLSSQQTGKDYEFVIRKA